MSNSVYVPFLSEYLRSRVLPTADFFRSSVLLGYLPYCILYLSIPADIFAKSELKFFFNILSDIALETMSVHISKSGIQEAAIIMGI